jgi:hypothetical protein
MLAQINQAIQPEVKAGTMPPIFSDVVPSDVASIADKLLEASD